MQVGGFRGIPDFQSISKALALTDIGDLASDILDVSDKLLEGPPVIQVESSKLKETIKRIDEEGKSDTTSPMCRVSECFGSLEVGQDVLWRGPTSPD